nr:tmv resistance protein n [Quercus suber]
MDLSDSQHLINTPDFNGFPNLKRLIFQGCTRLYKIYPSIGALKRLTLLNLKDCKHLHSLPHEINIESLEIFILSGCSRLRNFLEIERDMTRLLELYLDGTAIEELPSSFKHLTGLILLNLQECENISSFPQVICSLTSLKILNLLGCNSQPPKSWHFLGLSFIYATLVLWKNSFFIAQHPELEPINLFMPRSFSGLRSLVSLDLSDCNLLDGAFLGDLGWLSSVQFLNLSKSNFTHLPDSISQLPKRTVLYMDNCSRLQALPNLPLSAQFVMARGCASLQNYNEVVVWTPGET